MNIDWGNPDALYLLWVLPIAAVLLGLALRARGRALDLLGPLVARRVSANTIPIHRGRAMLRFGALAVILVAIAQPRWGFRWQER
ncbi:MAG: hypothetical protein AAFV53_39590, partial [Myxococcota bacterium]